MFFRLPLINSQLTLPIIFFITPTAFRPTQKADLTRLSQTLSHIANLFWIVVEDSDEKSLFVDEIIYLSRLSAVHLNVITPSNKKLKEFDPNWKFSRGVNQRNIALRYIRYDCYF